MEGEGMNKHKEPLRGNEAALSAFPLRANPQTYFICARHHQGVKEHRD